MNISRQIREELAKEYGFIDRERRDEVPSKRSRSKSPSPAPSTSAKAQLQRLKSTLDLEARQRKVEEFRRRAQEKKNLVTEAKKPEEKVSQGTPEFGKDGYDTKEIERVKMCRSRFPQLVLRDFPFLKSPDREEEIEAFFMLFDSSCSKSEIQEAMLRISSNAS